MDKLLKEKFDIENDGEEEKIAWEFNGRQKRCDIDFVKNTFTEFDYNTMKEEAPTEGWENIIEEWNELGKFE